MTDEFKDFRISLAGAQEKTAFLYHKKSVADQLPALQRLTFSNYPLAILSIVKLI